jgi:tricorn protease
MISELNVGHAYYSGGDVGDEPKMSVGMLGCDFALDSGAYKISRIFEGAAWDSDARGPLSQPGTDVKTGDYLLAVNGAPVDVAKDPWAAFQGLAGKTIRLTVSANPKMGAEARDVVVKAIDSETDLRYRAWIEEHRAYVEKKTGGKVGYVYVPSTGTDGQSDLVRQFFGQTQKAALVIDERWNSGGQIPTRFIELLNRPITNYWARRDAKDWPWPPDSHQGPKCMLINGLSGSGGDAFPAYFKMMGIGKVIGMRTWGGLVGLSGNPALIDGGEVTVPTFGYYKKNGTWGVEGHGVDPDIEVIDDPSKMVDGGDPQLDAAIELMLAEIQKNPYVPPKRPAYPDKSGMGMVDADK